MGIRNNIKQLQAAAGIMQTRAMLAKLAGEPGGEMLATRLRFLEQHGHLWGPLIDATVAWSGTEVIVGSARTGAEGLAMWLEKRQLNIPRERLIQLRIDLN